jgi:hypothetical protein
VGKKVQRREPRKTTAKDLIARSSGEVVAISRIEAIYGLLETAISLWVSEQDIGSIHVLACAAWRTMHDLGKDKGKAPKLAQMYPDLTPLLDAYDFFRHASSNLNVVVHLPPVANELILFDAINSFEQIFGGRSSLMKTFAAWFAVTNPLDSKRLEDSLHFFLPVGARADELRGLNRRRFFDRVLPMFVAEDRPPAHTPN